MSIDEHQTDPLDGLAETTVLLAQTAGRLLGSVSLTIDNPHGLPGEEDFPAPMAAVRDNCRRAGRGLAGFWRLATAPLHHGQLDVIMKLMTASLETLLALGVDEVLITVNPRHVGYYQRMIGFTVLAVASTAAVRNAPGVLLRGQTRDMAARWERVKQRRVSARLTTVRKAG